MCIIEMSINFCKYLHHATKNKSFISRGSNTILSTLWKVLISLLLGNLVKHYTGYIFYVPTHFHESSHKIKINHFA